MKNRATKKHDVQEMLKIGRHLIGLPYPRTPTAFTTKDAAHMTGISLRRLNSLIDAGAILAFRHRKARMVPGSELRRIAVFASLFTRPPKCVPTITPAAIRQQRAAPAHSRQAKPTAPVSRPKLRGHRDLRTPPRKELVGPHAN